MGIIGSIANHLKQRLSPRTIAREIDTAVMRAASQGAAELSQALYTGNPFVPYGPTEKPLRVVQPDKGNVHGTGQTQQAAPAQAPAVQPVKQLTSHAVSASMYFVPEKDYSTQIAEAAARMPVKDQGKGMER